MTSEFTLFICSSQLKVILNLRIVEVAYSSACAFLFNTNHMILHMSCFVIMHLHVDHMSLHVILVRPRQSIPVILDFSD